MALKPCPLCSTEISPEADPCPKCGQPEPFGSYEERQAALVREMEFCEKIVQKNPRLDRYPGSTGFWDTLINRKKYDDLYWETMEAYGKRDKLERELSGLRAKKQT